MSERSERNPGITFPLVTAPALAGAEDRASKIQSEIYYAPTGRGNLFLILIQAGAAFGRLPLAIVCNRYAVS